MKGNVTPIRSARYRDRMQVDLIDMRTCRRKKYIVVCKDHFTGFMAAACIPRKRASYVAYVLTDIFGRFGFPRILHTDNGKEFIGKPVLDMIRENSPFCTTVTGRPRTPRDQDSVENMNYHVRKALYALEEHHRRRGKEPNWTTKMGQMVAAMKIIYPNV
jgi:transposase InsO family protein